MNNHHEGVLTEVCTAGHVHSTTAVYNRGCLGGEGKDVLCTFVALDVSDYYSGPDWVAEN